MIKNSRTQKLTKFNEVRKVTGEVLIASKIRAKRLNKIGFIKRAKTEGNMKKIIHRKRPPGTTNKNSGYCKRDTEEQRKQENWEVITQESLAGETKPYNGCVAIKSR